MNERQVAELPETDFVGRHKRSLLVASIGSIVAGIACEVDFLHSRNSAVAIAGSIIFGEGLALITTALFSKPDNSAQLPIMTEVAAPALLECAD